MGKQLYSAKRELFRDLLKQVRVDAGLTQMQLAQRLGRHQSYVSDYERRHRRLDWVAVDEALAACGGDLVRFAKNYAAAARSVPS
ncbi:MAG: helix-turn-helix transcriptional regulator [Nevskia sp.]|nr:helix-turn-helix transcriptional regulator [Nevskia sp.]